MKTKLMMVVGVAMGVSACGAEVDELAPKTPKRIAQVAERATQELNTTMHDQEGRSYPVRIYYNDAAEDLIPRFLEQAYVRSHRVTDHFPAEASDDSSAPRAELTYDPSEPWFYVRLGTADDGTKGMGWTAPYSAVFVTRPVASVGEASPGLEGVEDPVAPAYSATAAFNFTVNSGNVTHETAPALPCDFGVSAGQTCAFWSTCSNCQMSMVRDGYSGDIDPEGYSGACLNVVSGSSLHDEDWRVRNKWAAGGGAQGTGTISCD